jgi:RNA polymerase sigma-70 factor (ECF subfamily)
VPDFLRSPARRAATAARSIGDQPWLQPYPDRLLDEAAVSKESIALGFLSLIQTLPARQRAVYILRDVLGWSAAETATALELTVAAANSALQRARDTVGKLDAAPTAPTADERAALAAFIDAHERGDAAAALAQMHKDIRITMPPHPMCFDGLDAVRPLTDGLHIGAWRLVPAWANRMPAAISYLRRPGDTAFRAFKIDVLRIEGGLVREVTTFEPTSVEAFGAPAVLEAEA